MMINYYEQEYMKELNARLSQCKDCANHNTRGGNFLSAPAYKVDVIFIAQNPGMSWYNKFVFPEEIVPFAMDNDKNNYHLFFDTFQMIYWRWFKRQPMFYITNIVKCVTKDNKLDDEEMIRHCIEKYLIDEIEYFKAQSTSIIVLGSPAKKALEANPLFANFNMTFAHHPGYLNRQGKRHLVQYTLELMRSIYGPKL